MTGFVLNTKKYVLFFRYGNFVHQGIWKHFTEGIQDQNAAWLQISNNGAEYGQS